MAKWIILLFVLIAALYGVQAKFSSTMGDHEDVEVASPGQIKPEIGKATLAPGRVLELTMPKGKIEIVLFEKDCPITTKRIASLAASGAYDGVKFSRVEPELIQTDHAKKLVKPITVELRTGLDNVRGAVAMARMAEYNSNVDQFYILIKPIAQLDQEYTVFGYVVRGMDVVDKTKKDDAIKSARLRPLTPEDAAIVKAAKLTNPKKSGAASS